MNIKYLATVRESNVQSFLAYPMPVHFFFVFAKTMQDAENQVRGKFYMPTFSVAEVKA